LKRIFQSAGMASFSRQPKTRDEQEAELEDELRAEFVRISLKNDPDGQNVRFRKKTYSQCWVEGELKEKEGNIVEKINWDN
jgi:hypothetical protein